MLSYTVNVVRLCNLPDHHRNSCYIP